MVLQMVYLSHVILLVNTLHCYIDWAESVEVLSVMFVCVCNTLVCLSQLHQWRWGPLTQGRC